MLRPSGITLVLPRLITLTELGGALRNAWPGAVIELVPGVPQALLVYPDCAKTVQAWRAREEVPEGFLEVLFQKGETTLVFDPTIEEAGRAIHAALVAVPAWENMQGWA